MNKVIVMGRLTADAEIRHTATGTAVCSFNIAVQRRFKNADGERGTDFFNVVAWRNQAEFINKYFHKGDMIGITGTLQSRKYEDKNNNKRTAIEIIAEEVDFCGKKNGENAPHREEAADDFEPVYDDGDLPF